MQAAHQNNTLALETGRLWRRELAKVGRWRWADYGAKLAPVIWNCLLVSRRLQEVLMKSAITRKFNLVFWKAFSQSLRAKRVWFYLVFPFENINQTYRFSWMFLGNSNHSNDLGKSTQQVQMTNSAPFRHHTGVPIERSQTQWIADMHRRLFLFKHLNNIVVHIIVGLNGQFEIWKNREYGMSLMKSLS